MKTYNFLRLFMRIIFLYLVFFIPGILFAEEGITKKDSVIAEVQELLNRVHDLYYNRRFEPAMDSATFYAELALNKAIATFGEDDSLAVEAMVKLVYCYRYQARYKESEALTKKCMNIAEKIYGYQHITVASCLNNLGSLCHVLGRYAESETYWKEALAIRESIPNIGRDRIASSQYNLAIFYFDQGQYDKCEPLWNKALAIREKIFSAEDHEVAYVLSRLGELYKVQERYMAAENVLTRALNYLKNDFGPINSEVAMCLEGLGDLYFVQARYNEAESLYKQALNVCIKALGPEHPNVAGILLNLGTAYYDQSKFAEAESLILKATESWEKVYGPDHPDVALCHNKMAKIYSFKGEIDKSLVCYSKLQRSRQNFIDDAFSYASEDQKLRYIQKYPLINHSFLSFALLNNSEKIRQGSLEMILKGKAIVLDAVSAEKEIAFCVCDERISEMSIRHAEISGEIANLTLAGIGNLDPNVYRKRLQNLYNIKDSLEKELSKDCSEFKDELASRSFKVADIAKILPKGSVLWEIVQYEPYDFSKIGDDKEKTGPARYLAFTLNHSGKITLTDLGSAAEIDSLIILARKIIYHAGVEVHYIGDSKSEKRLKTVTSALYDIIFAPLEQSLADCHQIFIAPDGQLNLLPFEILPNRDGKYAIEKYKISYLCSGRDLLKFKRKQKHDNRALAIADPDFDLSLKKRTEYIDKTFNKSEYLTSADKPSGSVSGCLNCRFDPLPYTRKETESVAKALKDNGRLDVEVYYGEQALEEVLKGMSAPPRVLHLSTHGFFCGDLDLIENKMLENPLLRSGIVLAGANRLLTEGDKDTLHIEDGILTAFEVSGLNLVNTELVTLSACETGVGEVKNSEGVYGLRRAFQYAGAQTILMSLWKVPDIETYELMNDFYVNWLTGQTKQNALHQAALKILHDRRHQYGAAHPYFWGAFVMLGNPQ